MQDGLIKRYAKFDSPLEEDLISVNIILEIDMGNDRPVLENIRMNFNKNSKYLHLKFINFNQIKKIKIIFQNSKKCRKISLKITFN